MTDLTKPKTYRDSKYLAYVRKQPCIICSNSSQAHHIYTGGMGIKCNDLQTAPLCPEHHKEIDSINGGKETFIKKYKIDWRQIRLHLLVGYLLGDNDINEDVRDILIEALEKLIERGETIERSI